MARRKQKFSREKARTMWLAWSAWLFIGGIFVFEDTQGGTGWLTWTMTAPFWLAFILWPFLWAYLATRRNPEYVEMDDDIRAGDAVCRLVQKNGVRYAEKSALDAAFDLQIRLKTMKNFGRGWRLLTRLPRLRPSIRRSLKLNGSADCYRLVWLYRRSQGEKLS